MQQSEMVGKESGSNSSEEKRVRCRSNKPPRDQNQNQNDVTSVFEKVEAWKTMASKVYIQAMEKLTHVQSQKMNMEKRMA